MQVSAWSNGAGTFGIRVGIPNRDKFFDGNWQVIHVEIDGSAHQFKLTRGFWNRCPEFRDSGATIIRDWLHVNGKLDWKGGLPPRLSLLPVGPGRFRLKITSG